jgi:pimeloyl-ACP methyl ester carboxylesterase
MTLVTRSVEVAAGLRLPYVEQGDPAGLPVLFLHGYTDSWRSFAGLLPCLPQSLRAIALTQRGHGDADRPRTGYAPGDFAADLARFMDALGIGTAVIAGHSMGGTIARRFALDYPDRTRGVTLLGAFATFRDNPEVRGLWKAIQCLLDPVPPRFAREFQESTLARPVHPAFLAAVIAESLKLPAPVWRAVLAGLLEHDFQPEPGAIAAPTLVVWGDQDRFVPRADQEALVAGSTRARLLVYSGAGHAFHWEDPARFAADLAAFCASLGPSLPPARRACLASVLAGHSR